MTGAIIGDIAGSRFEFNNHLNTEFQLFTDDCAFTDDTVCTIAVADALLKGISFEASLQYWCRKYPHPKGGYGGSFAGWVHSSSPQPYNSFGNGSAMRVSPCAWWSNDLGEVLRYARMSAKCTHNHPEGIRGASVIADCIYQARHDCCSKETIKNIAVKEYRYNLDMTCDSIRKTNTFNETCQVTVPQAIVCFLESSDFESAIRLAVSIGGDSDTIAAITGSIAEAFYGIPENIKSAALRYLPQEFISVLSKFDAKNTNDNSI
ncbi:MAG: ADP-ribosylglycohydrolase family protein [Prevotellaceae bacterium]|jgi:ADP-ribosylglycohydrolase|nr:ADP-ribosylglycohydrolase family protein [Prevotellaceae bacterium]